MNKALHNLKIIDLSTGISGAYCTRLFAGWGAEVIKVEQPGAGDISRIKSKYIKCTSDSETSAPYLYLNTNKKSITLNLESCSGINLLKNLLKDTDIIVENYEPGKMAPMGLGYEDLEKINPRLIVTSVTWFGQNGPYARYKGSAIVAYAMGGQMYVCGQPDREPLNAGAAVGEYIGGLYAFIGTMMALEYREQTGEGQQVDVSIFECLAGSHQFTLTWPAYSGVMLERPGWPGSRAPQSLYKCSDGYVNLRLQDIEMGFLSQLLKLPELATDSRFSSNTARNNNIKELEAIVTQNIRQLKKQEVFRLAGEWQQLCGDVATPQDLLHNSQYLERGFWAEIAHPLAGNLKYPGAPVKMTETDWRMERAPLFGENNTEIYCDRLRYTTQDIESLRESGII